MVDRTLTRVSLDEYVMSDKWKRLLKSGKKIFLDINLYDIPRTTKRTIAVFKKMGVYKISIGQLSGAGGKPAIKKRCVRLCE